MPKAQNYIGTQLADMILYPTYDSEVSFHSIRKDHFIDFKKDLKKKLSGNVEIIP